MAAASLLQPKAGLMLLPNFLNLSGSNWHTVTSRIGTAAVFRVGRLVECRCPMLQAKTGLLVCSGVEQLAHDTPGPCMSALGMRCSPITRRMNPDAFEVSAQAWPLLALVCFLYQFAVCLLWRRWSMPVNPEVCGQYSRATFCSPQPHL